MSRRNKAVKRPVPPDPRYDSQTVSKFVNNRKQGRSKYGTKKNQQATGKKR